MGIEPTGRTLYVRPSGFEDRGGHQPANRFRTVFHRVLLFSSCGVTFCDTRLHPFSCLPGHGKRSPPVDASGCHANTYTLYREVPTCPSLANVLVHAIGGITLGGLINDFLNAKRQWVASQRLVAARPRPQGTSTVTEGR